MPWYWYKRDGWTLVVDAVSLQDASKLVKREAAGARYLGCYDPSSLQDNSFVSAFVTPKRERIIHEHFLRDMEQK